jgi:hypothetical protein
VRVSGTVLGTAALLLGFYQAPFAHIHPDDLDHPATSTLVHWHFHHQAPVTPTPLIVAPTDDDDAIDVGWNALRCPVTQVQFDCDIAETVHLPAIALTSVPLPIPQRRGHDPPELAPKLPRAPPA